MTAPSRLVAFESADVRGGFSLELPVKLPVDPTIPAEIALGPRFRFLTANELAGLTPTAPLVKGVLSQGSFSAIVAPYSAFKSFLALDLDLCIGYGLDWHGFETTRGFVAYQAGEGGAGLHKRVEAWRVMNGLPDIGGIAFLPQSLKLNDARDLADLLAALRGLAERPTKITIDTYARSLRGNESATEDAGLYIEAVDAVRETIGAHVQIVHHTGWEGTRSRGSSSIPAALDTEITLARDGDRVTVTCTKQKDLEDFAPFTLEAVPIAGSLALRAFAPTSAQLSKNECTVLRLVQSASPLKTTKWQKDAEAEDVSRRSFYDCKRRLTTLGYVKEAEGGNAVTDAGRQVR